MINLTIINNFYQKQNIMSNPYCCQEKVTDCDATCFVMFQGTKTPVRLDTAYNHMKNVHDLLQSNIPGYPSWKEMKYTSILGVDLRHGWLDEEPRVLQTGDIIVATKGR